MFTVDEILSQHYPALNTRPIVGPPIKQLLRYLLKEEQFIRFSAEYPHLQGMDFVEQVLEYFNFSYTVSDKERENIPATGRVMIIANHPIGSLDGLALLKLIHETRSDVRIVANDLLMALKPLRPCLLPVRVMTGTSVREHIARIDQTLGKEEAVIVFPSGEVSRLGPKGVKDSRWLKGFLRLATRAKAPILPIHISGRNSLPFYATSVIAKPLSTCMLVSEMFKQQCKQIKFTIGALIPFDAYHDMKIREKDKIRLFRRHVYRLGTGKKPIFRTETAIARPERRVDLKNAIRQGDLLGKTPDGKDIYLYEGGECSPVLREITRLREVTFRAVGEGSGQRRDTDKFDGYYQHLVLWSVDDLEIVGAYRFVDAARVSRDMGLQGLYTDSLFHFEETAPFIEQGLELGRSFIQQRYWGKRSLDYLWYGIGAYLNRNPHYRYLFGPVSISNAMPRLARELLIYFYKLYFTASHSTSCSRNPFHFSEPVADLAKEFSGQDYRQDLRHLKTLLTNMGTSIPTLYKQYTELCTPGGVLFLDFNVDPNFNNCIDGLVVVDAQQIKPQKRKRYLQHSILSS